jgi:hypothetical protein
MIQGLGKAIETDKLNSEKPPPPYRQSTASVKLIALYSLSQSLAKPSRKTFGEKESTDDRSSRLWRVRMGRKVVIVIKTPVRPAMEQPEPLFAGGGR